MAAAAAYPTRAAALVHTRALANAACGEGEEVSKRTVERDLIALSASFAFTSETEGTTTYWFWPADAAALDVPGLDPAGALALVLAHEHLEPLLPASTLETLAPYLRRAQQVLDTESGRRLGNWRSKVRAVTRGPKLLKPRIAPAIHAAITDALLRERRVRARYRGRQAESIKEYTLNPLGLVAKEGVLYLIATAWNFDTPFQYALHRFSAAALLDEAAIRPAGFTLARYSSEDAALGYPESAGAITLVVDFDTEAVVHLRERPLSPDQSLTRRPDGRVRLSARVANTRELRWWLLGFGEMAKVVGPTSLHREFYLASKRMAASYARQLRD